MLKWLTTAADGGVVRVDGRTAPVGRHGVRDVEVSYGRQSRRQ